MKVSLPARKLDWLTVIYGLGLFIAPLLVVMGVYRAFSRGGNDFSVFYQAWKLVLAGHGADVYRVSPDRYLYSPGFAWVFSPLAWVSRPVALAFWCFGKILVLCYLVRKLANSWEKDFSFSSIGVAALGVVLIARPLLIDFEYGQVNLLILGVCVWALYGHFDTKSSFFLDFIRWLVLSFISVSKLFPMPLMCIPWVVTAGVSIKKRRIEKVSIFLGAGLALFIPLATETWQTAFSLLVDWREAVLARGLPIDSHNQSFAALLYHYLSSYPTHVISEGMTSVSLGYPWLSPDQISLLSLFWGLSTMGLLLGWIFSGSIHAPLRWVAVTIGLLIVPSHLIWKPYFVLSLPLAILIIRRMLRFKSPGLFLKVFLLFAGINLTGFDFMGHYWGSYFESASLFLLIHLAMITMAIH